MKLSDLDFEYSEHLVATSPQRPSRVLLVGTDKMEELPFAKVFELFQRGDLLVINDTKVEPRRVFGKTSAGDDVEVLFVEKESDDIWQVLLPTRLLRKDPKFELPDGVSAELVTGGRPQLLKVSRSLDAGYFFKNGEMPLPPYIQKARDQRHTQDGDRNWYQTEWAKESGSSAAPTASLHFSLKDLEKFRSNGVQVSTLTLHVGLGTYLPVTVDDLNHHTMHEESVFIPKSLIQELRPGRNVWALGTTVARALESYALGMLSQDKEGNFSGTTKLLIQEGFEWKVVNRLLTNFHQPQSTLLALVCGFAGKKRVLEAYKYAIEKGFRLFSYGDLSIWIK
jgi:S-adenosylmethionine:tRNA ribosyltransferase-isomerase